MFPDDIYVATHTTMRSTVWTQLSPAGVRETEESAGRGGGLSAGSIAAIALGVTIVVFGSLGAAFFLLRRKRKQRTAAGNQGVLLDVD